MTLPELFRRLENLLRVGTVEEVNGTRCRVKTGDLVTGWLPWFTQRAGDDVDWWPLEVGEQVMILSPGGELAAGYVLAGIYSAQKAPPSTNPNERMVRFADGASAKYNRAEHTLTIEIPEGKVIVSAPKIDLGDSGLEPSVLGEKMAAAMGDLLQKINASRVIGNLGAPTSPIGAVLPVESPELISGGNVYSQKNRNQ